MMGTSLDQVVAVADLNATQFVSNVTVKNSDGSPIGTNKISDSSTINVIYDLDIGDGSVVNTDQSYTMPLPKELNYETTEPIKLFDSGMRLLGTVTIKDGVISIQFDSTVKDMTNVKVHFNFYSKFTKDELNYDEGNDLAFPTRDNPENTQHINFSKSSSGGGSGTSAINKNLHYGDLDRTVVTWTIVVNNGGYTVNDSKFYDEMENTQEYVPGSMKINYRNWDREVLRSDTTDPGIKQEPNGKQRFDYSFGQLKSAEEKDDQAVTSITLTYRTKIYENPDLNSYPNTAYSSDGDTLIDSDKKSATYQGQGGGGSGDELTDIEGQKIWDDNNNADHKRPNEITVQLLRNGGPYKQSIITSNNEGNWLFSFTKLPQKDTSNVPYQYTVQEMTVPSGYTSTVEGTNITNKYIPETISVKGTKKWVDDNDAAGKRPESITVNLLADGKKVADETVTAQSDWQYSFVGLAKEKAGKAIDYTITEDYVENYSAEIIGNHMIINTLIIPHIPSVVSPDFSERIPDINIGKSGNTTSLRSPSENYKNYPLFKYEITNFNYKEYPKTNDTENFWMVGVGITLLLSNIYFFYKRSN